MAYPTVGAHPLDGVGDLPNVTVAFPGEHWSDRTASGAIVPGSLVVPASSGGALVMKVAASGDNGSPQAAIALRPVDVPDAAGFSQYTTPLGPNEIKNRTIEQGEYVHAYYSGVFHLTLVTPRNDYAVGQLVKWDPAAARPAGKAAGNGAWTNQSVTASNAFGEITLVRPYGSSNEVILTVRSLRGQF